MERRLRLREEWAVNDARRKGRSFTSGPIAARIFRQPNGPGHNRYAVVAGKRVGNAVQRNRCKRLIREAMRELHPQLEQGYDLVLIVRGGVDQLTGLDVASIHLETLLERARLLNRPAAVTSQVTDQVQS